MGIRGGEDSEAEAIVHNDSYRNRSGRCRRDSPKPQSRRDSTAHMNGPTDRVYRFSDENDASKKPSSRATNNKRIGVSRSRTASSGDNTSGRTVDGERSNNSRRQSNHQGRILPPPPGLKNVGNSCYANAALQCLLSTALPHALLSERNAHIIRRHSFNRKLLITGSGSVDSEERDKIDEEGSKDGDSLLGSYISGMTGLCSVEEEDEVILARVQGDDDLLASPAASSRTARKKNQRRDDGTVTSYSSLTSDMYHGLKRRVLKDNEPSEADLLCLWLTQELTQITREYTTPPQSFLKEKRKHKSSKSSGCTGGIIDSIFGGAIPHDSGKHSMSRVVDPGSITRHVHKISPTLRPYQQEDAHEFFRSLLSSLTMNGQNARLSSLFDGLLESSVTCKTCKKSSLTRDRYMDLSLDIADYDIINLERALEKFTREEILDADNMVTCSKCKVKRVVTKGLRLATAPTMLVINYKRFAYDNYGRLSRLSKQVNFPLRLELKQYMSRANRGKPAPYSLVAVLVHRGRSCDCGHYFAYVRKGQEWYLANDAIVTKVDVEEVLRAQAYVMVYEVEGMKERHNFDSYSRYHKPLNDLEQEDIGRRHDKEKPPSWDFPALTSLFEACEVGLCGASHLVRTEVPDSNPTSSAQLTNSYKTFEDLKKDESLHGHKRTSLVDEEKKNLKERASDAVQAYYKRGRSHTPSRDNRSLEKSITNDVSINDFESRVECHRRTRSVSRVDESKSSRNNSVNRYTKARTQNRIIISSETSESPRGGGLPPRHVVKREV